MSDFPWTLTPEQVANVETIRTNHPMADPAVIYSLCRSQFPDNWHNDPYDRYALHWAVVPAEEPTEPAREPIREAVS
jgi:hypothetical protein